MPRFFFHLHECGCIISDPHGRELPSVEEALLEGIKGARDVMCGEVRAGRLCLNCLIVIEDNTGREVGRVPFRDAVTISDC